MPREPPPHRLVGRAAVHAAKLCTLIVARAWRAFGDSPSPPRIRRGATPLDPPRLTVAPSQRRDQLVPRPHAHPPHATPPGPMPGAIQVRQWSLSGNNPDEAMRRSHPDCRATLCRQFCLRPPRSLDPLTAAAECLIFGTHVADLYRYACRLVNADRGTLHPVSRHHPGVQHDITKQL